MHWVQELWSHHLRMFHSKRQGCHRVPWWTGLHTMSETSNGHGWFAVRCLFQMTIDGATAYEERVTLWRAGTADEAIAQAEEEAKDYANVLEITHLNFTQSYMIDGDVVDGAEVFSLIRRSELAPDDYMSGFFDTGEEFQERRGGAAVMSRTLFWITIGGTAIDIVCRIGGVQ